LDLGSSIVLMKQGGAPRTAVTSGGAPSPRFALIRLDVPRRR